MFMRFLQLKINSRFLSSFKKFYEDIIAPNLNNVPGCLFAGLINSPENNEFISITFWENLDQAENYEKQGIFQKLIEEAKPFLSESAEWKIHLSDNMELEYSPVTEEPVIKKYIVKAENNSLSKLNLSCEGMFVRIVSAKIQVGKIEEFKKLYKESIIPELKMVNGCRYVYLIESINEEDEFISLSIWDNKECADNYELSGKFSELINKVKHTFSQFYLWKMALEKDYSAKVQTNEDLKVGKYDFVLGKNLK